MCICICISKWVGVLYEGGAEAIQLYFHREYEQEGHWLTTHVAVNTYKIQIIIITAATNMMATRYTGGKMRCWTKSKWLVCCSHKQVHPLGKPAMQKSHKTADIVRTSLMI